MNTLVLMKNNVKLYKLQQCTVPGVLNLYSYKVVDSGYTSFSKDINIALRKFEQRLRRKNLWLVR